MPPRVLFLQGRRATGEDHRVARASGARALAYAISESNAETLGQAAARRLKKTRLTDYLQIQRLLIANEQKR